MHFNFYHPITLTSLTPSSRQQCHSFRQPLMTSDPVVRIDGHACPRRKQERPAVVATVGDTVGKGDRREQASEVEIGRSGVGSTEAALQPAGGVTGEPQCLRICVVAASAEQSIEPKSEIDRSASPSEQVAVGERGGEAVGVWRLAGARRVSRRRLAPPETAPQRLT